MSKQVRISGCKAVAEAVKAANVDVIASYPIAALADSQQSALANAFVDLALSPQGRDVLARYGFLPAPQ